jgi:hypothetical protein
MEFYGHGFFSESGGQIFVSAQEKSKAKGYILIYDSVSLQLMEKWDSGGYRPHDLQLDKENSKHLIIANSGTPVHQSNLSWIDVFSGKVINQILPSHPVLAPAHINQTSHGDIYLMGSDNSGYESAKESISFGRIRRGDQVIEMLSPEWGPYFGEALNSFVDYQKERVWITLPLSNRVLVVDLKSFKVIKEFQNINIARSIIEIKEGGRRLISVSRRESNEESRGWQILFDLDSMELLQNSNSKATVFYSTHANKFKSI